MKKLLSALLALTLSLSLAVLPASALELDQARELLAVHYVDGVPPEVLELDSLDAILEAIGDPYTFYMTPEQYQSFNQSVNGRVVVGIGATVETAFDDGYRVMSVLPDSPALEAGIQPGDILVAVDGVDLTADIDPRVPIVGQEGTDVTVTLLRKGQRLDFTLTRRAVHIPIVTYEQLDSAGYIECISFGSTTAQSIQEAIREMDDHTAVWIMDLRANPGGDSYATSLSASLFTSGQVMLYFRDGAGEYYYQPGYPGLTDKPVIVLTSEHSASGSELFAGDIRAYDAGIALGQRTFGKGTAQIVLEASNCPYMVDGEAMKITAYRFFAPDGATNHITGVLPTLLISPENTEQAAMLLTSPKPKQASGGIKLELAGHTFYIKREEAVKEENRAAFLELLEALPPSAKLYKGTGSQTWVEIDPGVLATEMDLDDLIFVPRTFGDTADSPYAREINTLTTYGILTGYADGNFHPQDRVTRAQFCTMVASALDLPAPSGKASQFSDVTADSWYAGPIHAMADMGFISGYSDGRFGPGDTISYQEMVAVLSQAAAWLSMDGYNLNHQPLLLQESIQFRDFADWAQIPARNLDALEVLLDGPAPTDAGTREIAAALLCRLMERTHLIWG